MPTPCFVFDLDDVLLPTTALFQNPHIQHVLRTMDTTSLTAVVQAYQSFIHPDMHLIGCLHRLKSPKYILTNASRGHAHASLNALCITQYFQGQLDANCSIPLKPNRQMYVTMHNHIVRSMPNQSIQIIFFDDKIENLVEPRLLNWVTVWICGDQSLGGQPVPSFVSYVFRTVHDALHFFNI